MTVRAVAAFLLCGCLTRPSVAFAPHVSRHLLSPPASASSTASGGRSPPFRRGPPHRTSPASPTTSSSSSSGATTTATTTTTALGGAPGFELADLLYDSTSTAFDAWEWTSNLGAPAALVAGAVLVTLSETRETMAPRKSDKNWVRTAKQVMRFLLLSSFALEVVSIFVGTVTGTVLLSHGDQVAKNAVVGYTSPMALLHHHHPFEYLTVQIGFLQGLFNWLGAVALEVIIPKEGENKSARRMNRALASWLVMLTFWITAFYNHHLTFYSDYASMLRTYVGLFVRRYFLCKPIRPLSFLYGPAIAVSSWLTWRAFGSPAEEDDD